MCKNITMKKFVRVLLVAFCSMAVFLLAGCETENLSSLKDISRPYTGVYECEKISLGDRDMTDKFEKLTLELKPDGTFTAAYETAEGRQGSYSGAYALDTEKGEIVLSAKQGTRTGSFTFPYEKGTIVIDRNLFGTPLHAEFSMP